MLIIIAYYYVIMPRKNIFNFARNIDMPKKCHVYAKIFKIFET